jgi:hypothetical protein
MNNQNEILDMDELFQFEKYRFILDELVGAESRFIQIPSNLKPPLWIIAYDAVPQMGSTTAFTFGISLVSHESWRFGSPEIVLNINSQDNDWLLSLGAICADLRGTCPFSLGNVLRFGKPLSSESQMSAYFLFWPTILDKSQQQIQLSDQTINMVQAYPIFDSEREIISNVGAEKFFMSDIEFTDVKRKSSP